LRATSGIRIVGSIYPVNLGICGWHWQPVWTARRRPLRTACTLPLVRTHVGSELQLCLPPLWGAERVGFCVSVLLAREWVTGCAGRACRCCRGWRQWRLGCRRTWPLRALGPLRVVGARGFTTCSTPTRGSKTDGIAPCTSTDWAKCVGQCFGRTGNCRACRIRTTQPFHRHDVPAEGATADNL
jgi:hypothetical protein